MVCTILPYSRPRVLVQVSSSDHADRDHLRRGKRNRVARRDVDWPDQVAVLRHRRNKDRGKARECHRYRGDGPGLNHGEESPPVKKAPQRREGLAQVNVHAAGLRHHRRQFAVGKRRRNRQHAGEHPRHQHPAGAADQPRHIGGNDEDPRADHHRNHHQRGIEQSQALHKLLFRLLGDDRLAHVVFFSGRLRAA